MFCWVLPRQTQLLSCKPAPNVVLGTNTHFCQTFLQLKGHYRTVQTISVHYAWANVKLANSKIHLELFQLQLLLQNHHFRFPLLCCEEVKEPPPFNQDFWKLELSKHRTNHRLSHLKCCMPTSVTLPLWDTHKIHPSLHVSVSFPHYFLAMPNSECHITIS